VALASSEQRASRERLALLSATEEPTVPTPAVSGRPRKVPAAPLPAKRTTAPFWQRRRVQLAAALALALVLGAAFAALLSQVH
jgi:hypothetical protein